MDIATIIGLVSGLGIVAITVLMGGDAASFWQLRSLVLVLGGTFATTLLNYPLRDLLSMLATVKNAFLEEAASLEFLIERLVNMAYVARREGVLSLEPFAAQADDAFLAKGIRLAIDGLSPEVLRDVLATEISCMEERHAQGQSILYAMAAYAPAFGMIGTLIGLVQMLSSMTDPARIGSGMAQAILTTLYGAVLANVVFLPAAGKLKVRTANEVLRKEIAIEGVLAIQSGDNPRVVEEKLHAFVPPATRHRLQARS